MSSVLLIQWRYGLLSVGMPISWLRALLRCLYIDNRIHLVMRGIHVYMCTWIRTHTVTRTQALTHAHIFLYQCVYTVSDRTPPPSSRPGGRLLLPEKHFRRPNDFRLICPRLSVLTKKAPNSHVLSTYVLRWPPYVIV